MDQHPPTLARRSVIGAAWAVPVVSVVAAAPSYAASTPGAVNVSEATPVRPCELVAGQKVGCNLLTLSFRLTNVGAQATTALQVLLDIQIPYPTPGTDGRATTTASSSDFMVGTPIDLDNGPSRGADSNRQVRRFPLLAAQQLTGSAGTGATRLVTVQVQLGVGWDHVGWFTLRAIPAGPSGVVDNAFD